MTPDLFRDDVWSFVGAIFALVVPFLIYLYQRERRELAFGIFYETRLLSLSSELATRVQILFDGVRVENVSLVVLALKNSGNRPILATDFQDPVDVSFSDGATPLSMEISRQVPQNLDAQVEISDDGLRINPLLLNPGDYLIVKVLAAGETVEVTAKTRVIGISALVKVKHANDSYGRWKIKRNMVMLPIMSVAAGVYFVHSKPPESWPFAVALLALFASVPVIQWLFSYFSNERRRYVEDV